MKNESYLKHHKSRKHLRGGGGGSRKSKTQLQAECFVRGKGFPGGSNDKDSACDAGDLGSVPGSGRSPGEGNGNPHQYSCLENSMDRGAIGSQRVRHDRVHTHD